MPPTRHAKNGDIHIAWTSHGEGPLGIVLVTGAVNHLDVL